MERSRKNIDQANSDRPDADLVAACLDGDRSAWEALILRYQRLIYSIPTRMGLSPDDAADVFQAICLKLLQKLSMLRDHEKISSWLITSTTRESWRIIKRSRRERGPSPEDAEGDDLSDLESDAPLASEEQLMLERQQIVREAVSILPERCRHLISMLFYHKEDFKYTDVASRLDIPISSIGPTRARCLEKLKKLVEGKV